MHARTFILMSLVVAGTVLSASLALARSAQVIVTPRAAYRISYDNNVNNTKDGDITHELTPGVRLDVNTERSKNRLEAEATVYKYHDKDELDRTTQSYSLSSRNDLTERVRLTLNGSYENDYTISKIAEELAETVSKTGRQRLGLSTRLDVVVTERNLLGLSYGYGSTDYDRSDYVDYDYQSASADWTYLWTERFRLRASTGMDWYDTDYNDGDGSYEDVSFMVGFDYDLNEIWTWSVMSGYLKNSTTADRTIGRDVDKDGDGYVGNTRLAWDYPRSDGFIEYGRDYTIGLSGETVTRDRFRLREKYLLTERSRLVLDGVVTLSESDGSINERDSAYYRIHPSYEYDLSEHWTWAVGGSYEWNQNHITSSEYDRSKVYMEIRWALPEEL